MAPLQRPSLCQALETGIATGPCGKQYLDNDGHTRVDRPQERHGYQSFTHGVTIFQGGIPHDVRPPKDDGVNHGTVLFTSNLPHMQPNHQRDLKIKPGTLDERQGMHAYERNPFPNRDVAYQLQELNHGTVLHVYPQLKPDVSYEGRSNVIGGRPTERWGARGGFTTGVRIWAGGKPRDVPIPAEVTNHGTVLFTSDTLHADTSHELHIKPGTCDERQGRIGSFEHGDTHLHMPTAAQALLWQEAGQKGGRRCGQGHYLAGTTVHAGGEQRYGA